MKISHSEKATIRKEITVKANPIVVWETLTTKEGVERFFNRKVEIDLREGGKATFHVSETFSYDAHFTKVIPMKKLAWEERYENETIHVEWTMETDKGEERTKIIMVSSGFGQFNEGVEWGWETSFRCLKWVLEEGYDRRDHPYLGIKGGLIGMGFQIYDVIPNSPADKAGIKIGDRILGMGLHTLCGVGWVADVLYHYAPNQPLEVRVVRKGDWIPEKIEVVPSTRFLEMGEKDGI